MRHEKVDVKMFTQKSETDFVDVKKDTLPRVGHRVGDQL